MAPSIAFSVVGGLGIDTSGYSIPYLTSWSQHDADIEIVEARAELIDHHERSAQGERACWSTTAKGGSDSRPVSAKS